MTMGQVVEAGSTDCVFKITQAVATQEGVDSLTLPPLNDYIDPEALSTIAATDDENITIQFTYHDYEITVTGSGSVNISGIE